MSLLDGAAGRHTRRRSLCLILRHVRTVLSGWHIFSQVGHPNFRRYSVPRRLRPRLRIGPFRHPGTARSDRADGKKSSEPRAEDKFVFGFEFTETNDSKAERTA